MMQAVAFGMGGGLLQKVNRDTMSFATKLSHVTYADGTQADIMKSPTGDASKISFPGVASSFHHARLWLCGACSSRQLPDVVPRATLQLDPKLAVMDAGPVFGLCLSACGMRVR